MSDLSLQKNSMVNWNRNSLISRVSVSMLLLTICSIIGMALSAVVATSMKGNAHAINRIGYMRMQSYQLLSMVPLDTQKDQILTTIENSHQSPFLENYITERGFTSHYQKLQSFWLQQVKPSLLSAQTPDQARPVIKQYVDKLDQLVHLIDKQTEHRLSVLNTLQTIFIVFILLLLCVNIWHLRRRLFHPWRQLLNMTFYLKNGQLSTRYPVNDKKDEMNQLGAMFNSMADELQLMYTNLESLVEQKTESLQYKNRLLDFLYRSSGPLISDNSERYCQLFSPILFDLQSIIPAFEIRLEVLDYHRSSSRQVISTSQQQRPEECIDHECAACIQNSNKEATPLLNLTSQTWLLEDGSRDYGALIVSIPQHKQLTTDEQQLIDTLSKQITRSLASKYQEHLNGELLLSNERNAIARELHDSLAQSLSCLKIRLSCLQMQQQNLTDEQQDLVKEMRHEIDVAYSQLRQLLSTFRLKLSEPGLLPALKSTINEFNQKLGFDISLNYQVPANHISSHQALHLLQVVREALSNVYKHAHATEVELDVSYQPSINRVTLTINDNGCGMSEVKEPANHYGLTIMSDRAKLLPGQFDIESQVNQGTKIVVAFTPQ